MSADSVPVTSVTVNFNCSEKTVSGIAALRASLYPHLSVLVIDNASHPTDVTKLPAAETIKLPQNLGYAAACNYGIKIAHQRGAEFVWLVTPDVRPTPDCLGRMVKVMQTDPKVGTAVPRLNCGTRFTLRHRIFPRLGYWAFPQSYSAKKKLATPETLLTDYGDGGAILIRLALWLEIGPLNEAFFLYFEDTEYGLRSRAAGWKNVVCPYAIAETGDYRAERNHRSYYMTRNALLCARFQKRYLRRTLLRVTLTGLIYCLLDRLTLAELRKAIISGLTQILS